jgi:diguanylate cyclase (GGDEF)-like protein/PAS domain S-box-containing protein
MGKAPTVRRRAGARQTTEAILANSPVGIAILDSERRIVRTNRQYCALYGISARDIAGKSARILYETQDQFEAMGRQAYPLILAGGTFDGETAFRRVDGREIWLHLTGRLVDPADPSAGIVWAAEDITARKLAEARIGRLTNLFAALSQCNQAIARAKTQDELFPVICRHAVELGGMKMAWIGMVGDDKRVTVLASHGDRDGLLAEIRTSADDTDPFGRGATGRAIRSGQPYWCQDFESDTAMQPWLDFGERFGCRSLASLPLCRGGLPVGCLTLYSDTISAFDEDARSLLVEMAADISFALDNFAREDERRKAVAALRIAATAFESQEAMAITDADKVIIRVNKAFVAITGYTPEEAVGRKIGFLRTDGDGDRRIAPMRMKTLNDGSWQGEVWNRRRNGEIFPAWAIITAVRDDLDRITHYVTSFTDTSKIKASEEEIRSLAFYDPLTRLPNRRLLLDRLRQALAASLRNRRPGALLVIDLDNFKTVNDTLGHLLGDQLLQQVTRRFEACLRDGDTLARPGGDEFVVILEDLQEDSAHAALEAEAFAHRLLRALAAPILLATEERFVTACIGLSLFGVSGIDRDETLRQADMAMCRAKQAGPNAIQFFDPGMQASVTRRAAMETDLRLGLRHHAFFLCYQPQVDRTGQVCGAEALVRWRHPKRGIVMPGEFIPVAEESGLILPLGRWILETACLQLVAWAKRRETAGLTLAVNVSARQFRQTDFARDVLAILHGTGANPTRLKLELTESLVLDDVEDIIAKMSTLKTEGVEFSFDDFGTGYSSLAYLKRLPLSQLKVDRSFVRDVLSDPNDAAVVRTIIVLARSMGLSVIAEGVETEGQRDFLAGHECHHYQGFLFGQPMILGDFEQLLDRARVDQD